jgi:meiotically up-regulated gene 157 (Mug157) protein
MLCECIVVCAQNTDADKGVMHESFNPNKPAQFTRPWFAWANSLFAELVREKLPLLLTTTANATSLLAPASREMAQLATTRS